MKSPEAVEMSKPCLDVDFLDVLVFAYGKKLPSTDQVH